MTESMRRNPLVSYFVLTYAGSWLVWAPWWLARNGVGLLPYELPRAAIGLVNAAGLFAGPFLAAFLVTRVVDGRGGVRQLWRRIWQVRAGWLPYLLALVAIPAAVALPFLLAGPERAGGTPVVPIVIRGLITWVAVFFLGGAFAEEPGWRGFALPRLQARFHPLSAALLLGVLWCAWHAPLFLTKEWDTPRSSLGEVLAYLGTVVALSVVMSWVTNLARGSVFVAAVAHNSVNVTLGLLGSLLVLRPSNVPFMLGMLALAGIAVLASKGRLGLSCASQSGWRSSDRPSGGGL